MQVELGIVAASIAFTAFIENLSVFMLPISRRNGPYPFSAVIISGLVLSCVPISIFHIGKQLVFYFQ
jgi:hypothetical protein